MSFLRQKHHFILLVLFCSSFGLRFFNIETKDLYNDEAVTLAITQGTTVEHQDKSLHEQGFVSPQKFKETITSFMPGTWQTILNLKASDPTHSPVFYIIAHFAKIVFKPSLFSDRYISAFLSSLLPLTIYLLSMELTGSLGCSLLAASFTTFSPLCLIFAQEARDYGLAMVVNTLLAYLLLRALRLNSTAAWILYALSLTFGFYTFALLIVAACGHTLYICTLPDRQHQLRLQITALVVALLLYSPWLLNMISLHSPAHHISVIAEDYGLRVKAFALLWFPCSTFFDSNLSMGALSHPYPYLILGLFFALFGFIFYFFFTYSPKKVVFFPLTQAFFHYFFFAGFYFMGAKGIFLLYRYFLSVTCVILISVAAGITNLGKQNRITSKDSLLAKGVALLLISSSIFSGVYYLRSATWWIIHNDIPSNTLALKINSIEKSTVISSSAQHLIALVNKLNANVKIYIDPNSECPPTDNLDRKTSVYLINVSEEYLTNYMKCFTGYVARPIQFGIKNYYEIKLINS